MTRAQHAANSLSLDLIQYEPPGTRPRIRRRITPHRHDGHTEKQCKDQRALVSEDLSFSEEILRSETSGSRSSLDLWNLYPEYSGRVWNRASEEDASESFSQWSSESSSGDDSWFSVETSSSLSLYSLAASQLDDADTHRALVLRGREKHLWTIHIVATSIFLLIYAVFGPVQAVQEPLSFAIIHSMGFAYLHLQGIVACAEGITSIHMTMERARASVTASRARLRATHDLVGSYRIRLPQQDVVALDDLLGILARDISLVRDQVYEFGPAQESMVRGSLLDLKSVVSEFDHLVELQRTRWNVTSGLLQLVHMSGDLPLVGAIASLVVEIFGDEARAVEVLAVDPIAEHSKNLMLAAMPVLRRSARLFDALLQTYDDMQALNARADLSPIPELRWSLAQDIAAGFWPASRPIIATPKPGRGPGERLSSIIYGVGTGRSRPRVRAGIGRVLTSANDFPTLDAVIYTSLQQVASGMRSLWLLSHKLNTLEHRCRSSLPPKRSAPVDPDVETEKQRYGSVLHDSLFPEKIARELCRRNRDMQQDVCEQAFLQSQHPLRVNSVELESSQRYIVALQRSLEATRRTLAKEFEKVTASKRHM